MISNGHEQLGHERGTASYKRILIALFCAGIATFAQLYGPQGLLPLVSGDFQVSAADASLVLSATTTGVALSVMPWSLVADRFGRLSAMRVALISTIIFGLFSAFFPWYEAIVAARFLVGIALGGIPAIAITYLAEEISRKHLAVAAGTYVSGTTIGGLAGRLIGAPLGDRFGWQVGILAIVALSSVMVFVFLAITPKALGFKPRKTSVREMLIVSFKHLRTPKLIVLYASAFLLMGAFVAVYNYLPFRLEAAPFYIAPGVASFLFLAYLAGTVATRAIAGAVTRFGRAKMLTVTVATMMLGVVITLSNSLIVIIVGLVILTAGFFSAHSIALSWSGIRADSHQSQSTSLYYLFYYGGSSVVGYLGGFAYAGFAWVGVIVMVLVLTGAALLWTVLQRTD